MKSLAYILIVLYPAYFLSVAAERPEDEEESHKKRGTVEIADISSFNTSQLEDVNREGRQRSKETIEHDKARDEAGAAPSHLANFIGAQWGLTAEATEYLFANSNDLVCLVEFGGTFKRINKRWTEVLGWTEQELLEAPYLKFIHTEDVQQTLGYERSFTPIGLINRYRCKNGSYRYLEWIGISKTHEPEKEKPDAYPLTIARDVTLQKFLPGIFADQSSNAKSYQFFNQRVLESIVEVQAVHSKSMYENEHEKAEVFRVALRSAINLTESRCGFIVEALYSREMRSFLYYNWEAGPLLSGELGDFLKQDSPASKFAVFSSLLDQIINTRKWLIINNLRECEEIIGSETAQLPYENFVGIPLITRDEIVGIICLVNRPGGYNNDLLMLMNPLSQTIAQIMDLVRTARWKALTESESKAHSLEMERVEAATAAKTAFIAHMSHEMRTPLGGIIGMLGLVNKGGLSEQERADYTQTAEISAQALLNIANDVLDLSKLEAGVLKLDEQELKPRKMVEESVRLLKIEAAKKNLSLSVKIKNTVPKVLIGDKTRIGQILFNLVGNAIKFTEHGSVSVVLDGTTDPNRSDVFTLTGSIMDTGIGMKPEVLARLFRPFSQGEESITRRFGGTGLGLFISKQLCEKMEGSITVSSEVGKGSAFSFKVNLRKDGSSTAETPASPVRPTKLPRIDILAAEDNKVNQKLLNKFLKNLGCNSVTMVSDGLEAVEACQQQNYDVILMDIEMPQMNGIEAMQEIRKLPDKKDLPIICVTAHALVSERETFLNAGMSGCLSKPYSQEELFAEIIRCLQIPEIDISL